MNFQDVPTFGVHWKGHYLRLGVGSTGRKDNAGRTVSLPKGAVGYVVSATPGSVLVVFGVDATQPPQPPSAAYPVTHRRYAAVCTFVYGDWQLLKLELSA